MKSEHILVKSLAGLCWQISTETRADVYFSFFGKSFTVILYEDGWSEADMGKKEMIWIEDLSAEALQKVRDELYQFYEKEAA